MTLVSLLHGILRDVADQWEIRFDNHPVWGALATLREQLSSIDIPTDPALADSYNRVLRLITTVETYREAENAKDLFTSTMLQSVHNAITQYVVNPLAQYVQDPPTYPTLLTQAADAIDAVYDELAKWPTLSTRGRAVAAGQAAAQYEEASVSALASFSAVADELEGKLTALRAKFDEEIGYAGQARTEEIVALNASSRKELDSLRQQIGSIETLIDDHRAQLTTLTDTTQTSLKNKLEAFQESADVEIHNAIEKEIKSIRDETDSTVAFTKKSHREVDQLHKEVTSLTKETRNTVEAFARRAVADDYQKNARNKSFAGWFWDIVGFIVGAVPLSLILYHFLVITESPISVANLTLSRVGISLAAVGVAGLCFHRGRQNHKESRLAKRTDLRVRTVHQFLANLDPEVQQAVLEGMADQIYLQGKLDDTAERESDKKDTDLNLLGKYLDKITQRRERREYEESEIR